eukprot:CAMPEP_0119430680 /NCGR_PEP_ID=MMETSP1335-20130426/44561_1 /TAXON_ID=259385 /ORGANISM="Chrysoculter rhomboideus, Strain RCC1486" /LENGTH=70 /DNA_ID=CAMNT_0007456445 /DNA_START=115 /DNA_END=323 /DNA_ORIENTATION=-
MALRIGRLPPRPGALLLALLLVLVVKSLFMTFALPSRLRGQAESGASRARLRAAAALAQADSAAQPPAAG